jgi:hypothetical protein
MARFRYVERRQAVAALCRQAVAALSLPLTPFHVLDACHELEIKLTLAAMRLTDQPGHRNNAIAFSWESGSSYYTERTSFPTRRMPEAR